MPVIEADISEETFQRINTLAILLGTSPEEYLSKYIEESDDFQEYLEEATLEYQPEIRLTREETIKYNLEHPELTKLDAYWKKEASIKEAE